MALLSDISIGVRVSSSGRFTTRRLATSSPDSPSRFKQGNYRLGDTRFLHTLLQSSGEEALMCTSRLKSRSKRPGTPQRKTPWPTPLCIEASEKGIREHDGLTVGASPTNSPDERCKEVVEYRHELQNPLCKWFHNCPA